MATIRPIGLYTSPNEHGEIPPGGLTRADDVVMSKERVLEVRRGQRPAIAGAVEKIWPFSDRLLVHAGSTLSYTDQAVTTKTNYAASLAAVTGRKLRAAFQSRNAYLATAAGVKRLESVTGVPVDAGVPMGLDVQGSVTGSSGFLPADSAAAYRVVWGVRDANGNLLLGAPSGRAVVANFGGTFQAPPSTLISAVGSGSGGTLAAGTYYYVVSALGPGGETLKSNELNVTTSGSTSSVALTWSAVPNATGYRVYRGTSAGGESVYYAPGAVTTYTDTNAASTGGSPLTPGSRDLIVSTSIPSGLLSGAFWQLYRTANSVGASIDPGDEMGLVYEGAVPQARLINQFTRTTNVVTVSSPANGFSVGQIVRVSPGASQSATSDVAIGDSGIVTRSTDHGQTWSTAGITGLPAGQYRAAAYGNSTYVVVGLSNACASSPDGGLTWYARTIPAGSYYAVTWTGSRFVAVGNSGVTAYSTDGSTWVAGSGLDTTVGCVYRCIGWNGSTLVTMGGTGTTMTVYTSANGTTWTATGGTISPFMGRSLAWTGTNWVVVGDDGSFNGRAYYASSLTSWTPASIASPNALYSIATNGTVLVAVGYSGPFYSSDGISWTSSNSAGSFESAIWDGANFIAAGPNSTTSLTAPAAGYPWTTRTITSGNYRAASSAGAVSFAASEVTLTATTSNTFSYAEAGADGVITQNSTATPLTATVVDQIPSTFAGATLYTSQSQDGILASQFEPPLCNDLALFRGSIFWLGTTSRALLDFWLLAGGAPSGVVANDTVTINGMVFTAKATENVGNREFAVVTSGTPSTNVRDTAASLIRVVNRAQGSPVYARDSSAANEQPGHVELWARVRTDSITIDVSRASSFALSSGTTKAPESNPHRLMWSQDGRPDAATVTGYLDVGDRAQDGLRVVATRDSLFVVKKDGIWRATGDRFDHQTPPTLSPFDTTSIVIAPETVAILDNVGFALSNKGVIQFSDTGVTIISRPIEDQIRPLLVEPMLSTVRAVAHAVAYESDGKYVLWVPSLSSDTIATRAFVYDHFASLAQGTPAWTRRTDSVATAVVNPYDGKLYTGDASYLRRERKALDYTDFADGEIAVTVNASTGTSVTLASAAGIAQGDMLVQSVYGDPGRRGVVLSVNGNTLEIDRVWTAGAGAATVYKAIPSVVEFAPLIPTPGAVCRFTEAALLFRWISGGYFSLSFSTEIVPAVFTVGFYGTRDYGLDETNPTVQNLRTLVTRDHQRAERLKVKFDHVQAMCPFAFEGVAVVFKPLSTRLAR